MTRSLALALRTEARPSAIAALAELSPDGSGRARLKDHRSVAVASGVEIANRTRPGVPISAEDEENDWPFPPVVTARISGRSEALSGFFPAPRPRIGR